MIRRRDSRTPDQAASQFAEWGSLFPKNSLFVKIAVYSDESGTHDPTGRKPGSREALIAGFAAPMEEWKLFYSRWQAILNKYSVRYFHFWEWAKACLLGQVILAADISHRAQS